MLKAMVMAAGIGSRLEPLTQDLPKPLMPIANKPVMDILFERLKEINVTDVIANTHYLGQQIINRYENNDFGINFNYINEKELSGTAGGVKKCQFFFDNGDDFLVLSADGVSNADFLKGLEIHRKSGVVATIGIKQVDMAEVPHFGVVVTSDDGLITEFQEKPSIENAKSNFINTGIYIFSYKIFDYIPANSFCDFAKNVFPKLLAERQIDTFEIDEYWSDIGTLEQYKLSVQDLFNDMFSINNFAPIKTESGAYVKGDSYVASSAKFIGNSTIGDKCVIGKNVVIENCIIWDDVEIADNVHLQDSVIASHCEISTNLSAQIIGQNQRILAGVYK